VEQRKTTPAGSFEWGKHYPVFKDIELTSDILLFITVCSPAKSTRIPYNMLEYAGGEIEPMPLYCKKR
jgi:hypothetical protein